MTTEAALKPLEAATGDFEPEQKRYLEGFAAGLQIARTAKGRAGPTPAPAAGGARSRAGAGRPRSCRAQGAGPRAQGRRQAVRSREVQAGAASLRHVRAVKGTRRQEHLSKPAGQFSLR